jgi:putative ABC transport system permease protein
MAPYAAGTALRIGADALFANPLRTLLSTIGVIIGVASLVAVLSLGDGMQNAARTQMEHLTDVQTVSVAPKTAEQFDGQWIPIRNYPTFTPVDAADAAAATGASGVSLYVRAGTTLDYPQTGLRRATSVSGVLSRADEFHHMVLAEGRFFTNAEADRGASVVVLSHKLSTELAAGGDARRIVGHDVRVNGVAMSVIGVLDSYDGEVGYDAYIPFQHRKFFRRALRRDPPRSCCARLPSKTSMRLRPARKTGPRSDTRGNSRRSTSTRRRRGWRRPSRES